MAVTIFNGQVVFNGEPDGGLGDGLAGCYRVLPVL